MATEDILISDGDSFISLTALTAAQVDAKLPISDNRDPATVKLDSPSANTFTVSTGGSQSVIVTADKRVGFGATPAASVQFQLTGSNATGMRTDLLHNSATRYQNSDGQLMVTTADGTSNIAVMSGFRIVGKSNAGATVDQYWGVYVTEVPALAVGAGGVRTAINGDGADEGKASVSGVFNVYADGTAPNYFGGDVRIKPTAQLNVNKIVGATAPDNDASIELGAAAKISAGTSYYQLYSTGYHVFQSDGSQSRFTNDGDFLIGTQTPFSGGGAIPATKTVVVATGKKGIARWSAQETSSSQTTDLYISCDYDTSEIVFQSNDPLVLKKNDGSDYTPTQPNSIATKQTVDDKIWVGTTAQYNALTKNPTTLYCLTD